MKQQRIGRIDISALNAPPEKHEYETARYFTSRGLDIAFIKPSNIKGTHSPDYRMLGRDWEIKSPIGKSNRTFEDNLRKAIKQSPHIIFDLRRLKPDAEKMCLMILSEQSNKPEIRTLLAITRDGRLLTIKGEFSIM